MAVMLVQTGSGLTPCFGRPSPGSQQAAVCFLKRGQALVPVSVFLLLSVESHGFELKHEWLHFLEDC